MTDPQAGDNSVIGVDFSELNKILEELVDKKLSASELSGVLRSRIKEILTDTGWHKGALAQIRSIDAMSETGRVDFLRTFEPMFEVMMQNAWRSEMDDLLAQLEDEGAD